MIKGITIKLINRIDTGERDDFGATIYRETETEVDDVLVAPASSTDIIDSMNLYGKKCVYLVAIPKGDYHVWDDAILEFFGRRWHVFAIPTIGIEDNIPLRWNMKLQVEAYE